MKYIKTFESHRNKKNTVEEPVNEEFFGAVVNFFKNLWNKAMEELKKLGDNPSAEKLDEYIEKNAFNPADDTYLFKGVIDNFKKNPEAESETCLKLVGDIIDPATGTLGDQGMGEFIKNLDKNYGENKRPVETLKFYIETARNKVIKEFKYAGGPDLKVGQPVKLDPKLIKMDLTDMTHLPDVKKLLTAAGQDAKKKHDSTLAWVEKTLIPKMITYVKAIKPEELIAYLESKQIDATSAPEFVVGDTVVYKRGKFDEAKWKTIKFDGNVISQDDLDNNAVVKELMDNEGIGVKKVSKIEGDKVSFEDADFTKTKTDILIKVEGAKAEGQEELVKKLGELKTKKPEDIKKVSDFVDFIGDEKNKDKVVEIDKILKAEEGGE
jgi:ribosomal protein L19